MRCDQESWDSWGWGSTCIDALGRWSSSKVDWKHTDDWGGYGYECRCKSNWFCIIWAASVMVDKTVNYTVISLACCTRNGEYCRDRTSKLPAASEPCAQQHHRHEWLMEEVPMVISCKRMSTLGRSAVIKKAHVHQSAANSEIAWDSFDNDVGVEQFIVGKLWVTLK